MLLINSMPFCLIYLFINMIIVWVDDVHSLATQIHVMAISAERYFLCG